MRILGAAMIVGMLLVGGCGPSGPGESPPSPAEALPGETWQYFDQTDEMSGRVTQFACVLAREHLPGAATSSARPQLCFFRLKGYAASLSLDLRGLAIIDCDPCEVRTRVDEQAPVAISARTVGNRHTSIDFLDVERTMTRLKGGKVLSVEVPLLDDTAPIITFNVAGLKWEPQP